MSDPAAVLPPHTFLGDVPRRRAWRGFAFAEVVDRAEENIPRHTHSDAHFLLLLRGRYVSEARGAGGVCGPATLLFAPPGTTHRDRFATRGGSFFTASLEPALFDDVVAGERFDAGPTAISAPPSRRLMRRIYEELRDGDDFSAAIMAGLTMELLASTARAASPRERRPPAWLRRALDEIEAADAMPSVAELASRAGVHPLHFARTFRRFQRCSPGEYLRRRRAERAAELILQTRLPLADVAQRSGFSDQSHLTRAMRRYFGATPARLRR